MRDPSAPIGRLARALARKPGRSLGALVLVTAVAAAWGSGIPIRSDMEALFPDDTPNVVRAREARETLGSRSQLQVILGGTDAETNRALGAAIASRLEGLDELIGAVEFRRDISFFETNALLFLPPEDLADLERRVATAIAEAVADDLGLGDDDWEDEPEEVAPDAAEGQPGEATSSLPTEAELKERYGGQDLSEYFANPEGTVLAVKAYPLFKPANTGRTKALIAATEAAIAEARAEVGAAGLAGAAAVEVVLVGDYTNVSATIDQITVDLARSSGAALFLIVFILAVWFRRVAAVALVMLPLLAGVAWTVCFARVAIGNLNLITAFIFSILIGLGIDFAVHAASRVEEERRLGHPLPEALPRALSRLGRAMIGAAFTTMATFLALTVFDFRGFSQFGWIAAGGVAMCLLAVYLWLPPLAMVLDRVGKRAPAAPVQAGPGQADPPPRASVAPAVARRWAWVVVLVATGFVSLGAATMPELEFDGDNRKMRMKMSRKGSELARRYFNEAESRTSSPGLIITAGLEETEQVFRHLQRLTPISAVLRDVVSIYTFVPDGQAAKLETIAEIRRKVKNKHGVLEGQAKVDADRLLEFLEPRAFDVGDLPDWVKAKFTDTSGRLGRYVLLYPNGVKSRSEDVLKIQDAIGRIEVGGKTYYTTASWMIAGDAFRTVRDEGPLAVGLAALVVFLLLFVDLRRYADVLTAFLALVAGVVTFLGILATAGIQLNMFNVVVLPTIFGIGVDTAIHLMHRLREGDSVGTTLRTTGAAAAVSAATTAVGFGSLLLVNNEGLRSIGWVAVIGIGCTYAATTGLIGAVTVLRRTG